MDSPTKKALNELLEEQGLPPLPPWAIVSHHVTQKFMQVGTFAFMTASPLVWMYQSKMRNPAQPFRWGPYLRTYYPRTLGVSTGLGVAVALYNVFAQLDDRGVHERAYRLADNQPNNRVQRRGIIAAATSSLVYPILFDKGAPIVTRMLRGASFGYGTGIVVALILEGFFKRK